MTAAEIFSITTGLNKNELNSRGLTVGIIDSILEEMQGFKTHTNT